MIYVALCVYTLSFVAGESLRSVGVNVYCVNSSSTEVASRLSKLDDSGFLKRYQTGYDLTTLSFHELENIVMTGKNFSL